MLISEPSTNIESTSDDVQGSAQAMNPVAKNIDWTRNTQIPDQTSVSSPYSPKVWKGVMHNANSKNGL